MIIELENKSRYSGAMSEFAMSEFALTIVARDIPSQHKIHLFNDAITGPI
jgi:hypothetical protein